MTANVSGLTATGGATTITLSWTNPNDIPSNQNPCTGNRKREWFILRREGWSTGAYTQIDRIEATGSNPYNGHTSYVDTPPAGGPWDYIVYAQDSFWRNIGEGECEFSVNPAGANAFVHDASITGDDDPTAFNFANVTGITAGEWGESATYTVAGLGSGISAIARLSDYHVSETIGGDTFTDKVEIRKNGGAWQTASIYVQNGDTVQIRGWTDRWDRTVTRTVHIGGITDSISVISVARDITPDAFEFIDIPQAEVGTQYFSNTVTITGINDSVSLDSSTIGAMFSINGGAFGHTGFVSNGDTLQLYKGTATSANHTATVTMGSFTETWVLGDPNPPSGNQQLSAVAFTPSSDPIGYDDIRTVVGPDWDVDVSLDDWLKNGGYWDTSFAENASIPTSEPIGLDDLKGRKGEWKVEFPYGFSVVENPNLQGSATLGASPVIPSGQLNPPLEVKFVVDIPYTNGAVTVTGDDVWTDIGVAGVSITRSSVGETFGTITMHVRRKNSSEDETASAEFNLILRHEDEEF